MKHLFLRVRNLRLRAELSLLEVVGRFVKRGRNTTSLQWAVYFFGLGLVWLRYEMTGLAVMFAIPAAWFLAKATGGNDGNR